MTKFKLLEPVGYFANDGESSGMHAKENFALRNCEAGTIAEPLYTHDQLIQALTNLGEEIAGRFSNPYSNYDLVIKYIVKELIK